MARKLTNGPLTNEQLEQLTDQYIEALVIAGETGDFALLDYLSAVLNEDRVEFEREAQQGAEVPF